MVGWGIPRGYHHSHKREILWICERWQWHILLTLILIGVLRCGWGSGPHLRWWSIFGWSTSITYACCIVNNTCMEHWGINSSYSMYHDTFYFDCYFINIMLTLFVNIVFNHHQACWSIYLIKNIESSLCAEKRTNMFTRRECLLKIGVLGLLQMLYSCTRGVPSYWRHYDTNPPPPIVKVKWLQREARQKIFREKCVTKERPIS